ncbi:MAG: SDR family oxidoreductase [Deltaproteobacteria bacterium]|nr:SDR family oxidoreductase [Deltaproteobacteria bacterium]
MKSFQGRTAAITGAASGIGRALAEHLAKAGANVAICDVDEAGLAETAERVKAAGAKVITRRVDVSKELELQDFAKAVEQELGGAHLLVNNAGVGLHGRFEEQTNADFAWLMGINFWGVVYGTRAFLPQLLAKDEANLVNVSSVFGFVAPPGQAAYCAAKFAVRGFTESIRHEYAGSRLAITVVHPGGIKTNIANRSRAPDGFSREEAQRRAEKFNRLAARTSAERAAEVILKGVKGNKPRVLIGADAHLLDGLARNLPERYWSVMAPLMDPKGEFKSHGGR